MKSAHDHSFEETLFPQTPRIIDLGGNVGQFAMSMFALYPDALIHTYEPTPGLVKSDRWNWFVDNKAVVANDDKERDFNTLPSQPWANSLVFVPGGSSKKRVQCINIREVLKGPQIDLIKLDIEGAEYELLESLSIVELQKFRQWTVEFHNSLYPEYNKRTVLLIRKMEQAGFTTHLMDDRLYDVLFIR